MLVKQTAVEIGFDDFEEGILSHVTGEPFNIKADALPVAQKIMILQSLLMGKQLIVHFPEPILRSGGFSSFGGTQRMRMCSHRWEVTENKTQVGAQELLHLLDYRISPSAMYAFEVAILEQSYGRALRPRDVVAIDNRVFESNDFSIAHKNPFCSASIVFSVRGFNCRSLPLPFNW